MASQYGLVRGPVIRVSALRRASPPSAPVQGARPGPGSRLRAWPGAGRRLSSELDGVEVGDAAETPQRVRHGILPPRTVKIYPVGSTWLSRSMPPRRRGFFWLSSHPTSLPLSVYCALSLFPLPSSLSPLSSPLPSPHSFLSFSPSQPGIFLTVRGLASRSMPPRRR